MSTRPDASPFSIGHLLISVFGPPNEALPNGFTELLDRLASAPTQRQPAPGTLSDEEFRAELERVLPEVRQFARGLTRDRDAADDVLQETMMKAWAARDRFQAGTNMRAWCFVIARNHFYTDRRRAKFKGDWDETTALRRLAAPAAQEHSIHLADLAAAFGKITSSQREALLLVAANGLSYEEAATIMGSAVGTVKSRVSRGRQMLEGLMDGAVG